MLLSATMTMFEPLTRPLFAMLAHPLAHSQAHSQGNPLANLLGGSLASFWLPEEASSFAGKSDWLFYFVLWISVFFFLLITVLVFAFVIKYRHREGVERDSTAGHSTALELTWTIIPIVIVLIIYVFGFRDYLAMNIEPPNAYKITVTGQMWQWNFTYPNLTTTNELHVPINVPVRLSLDSQDVIHGFFIDAFRVKKDDVPGRYNHTWFMATKMGTYDVFCSQYCGTNHSTMRAKVVVESQADFDKWLEAESNWVGRLSPIQAGLKVYQTRGCANCHSTQANQIITGPSWRDVFGSQVPLDDGRTVTADEAYIRESILNPSAKIVRGFQNVMPTIPLKPQDLEAVIWYIKSISKNVPESELAPARLIKPPTSGPSSKPTTGLSEPTPVPGEMMAPPGPAQKH